MEPLEPAARRARVRLGLGAAVVLLMVGLGCAVLVAALSPRGESSTIVATPLAADPSGAEGEVFVHVLGAVAAPGLYRLDQGARVIDAVAAAGGFAAGAEQAGVNLARPVVDGEQIAVPLVGQAPSGGAGAGAGAPQSQAGGKVSLNSADQAALETLPRVGPALARRILDWREANGGFASIDDLKSVTGIGEKTFAGLKDLVTL